MKTIRKTVSIILAVMILFSILVVPINAIDTIENTESTVNSEPTNKDTESNSEPITSVAQPTKPINNKKSKVALGATINKNTTGATVAGGTIGNTYTTTDLKDIAYDSGDTVSGSVKYEYFTAGKANSKYRYPNGTNWYSGKVARITITIGKTKAVWTVDESSLKGDGGVDQGTGTLIVSRTGTSPDIPKFKYSSSSNSVASPWNGRCKNYDNTAYKGIIDHDKVTTIEIDSSVRNISEYLFFGFKGKFSKLLLHNYPDSTDETIKYKAFASSSVSNIIWNSHKVIEGGAFHDCNSLKTLDFTQNTNSNSNYNHELKNPTASTTSPYNEQYNLKEGCFQGCDNLKTVKMGGITTIPKKCFYGCTVLNNIDFGNVETIQAYAFSSAGKGTDGNGITLEIKGNSFNDKGSDSAIRKDAFRNCGYRTIKFTSTSNNTRTGAGAFYSSDNLVTVEIASGSSITTISDNSFESCAKLSSLNIYGSKVTTIGAEAFWKCDNLVNGKTSPAGNANLFGYTDSAVQPSRNASNYNVLELPYTISTIRQGAFRRCSSLRALTWNNIANVTLKTIAYNTFYNDYQLQFFALPDSVETIEGTFASNVSGNDSNKFGAFNIDENTCKSNNLNHQFYFAVGNKTSKLKVIGDKAFFHPVTMKSTSGEGKGLYFWDRTNKRKVGNESSDTTLLVFKYLNYIGDRAFMNNPELTGCLLSEVYLSLGERSFVNTKLTDFYFVWNPNNNSAEATATKVASSVIGSSNSFINAQSRGYSHSNWESILNNNGYTGGNATMYTSIYRLINDTNSGLISMWSQYFKDLFFINDSFNNWKADLYTKTDDENWNYTNTYSENASQPSLVPELTHGKSDNEITTYKKDTKDVKTSTFLQTQAEWIEANKTAKETVKFGYKNDHTYDFIFVVDNSPSMDRAAYDGQQTGYLQDQATPYEGVNNASKMMNAYAQIYDISEKVLQNTNNTVSVISFRGTNENSLEASSKYITKSDGTVTMNNASDVKQALFSNDNGYDDNNDGYTNYSSGLSRAYQLIYNLQHKAGGNQNEQVVIFLTDGRPTYYNGEKAVSAITTNSSDYVAAAASQVDGKDWAAAIRGDKTADNYNSSSQKYSVHSYSSSKYDFVNNSINSTTENVQGLNTNIYGVLIGNENSGTINAMKDNITKEYEKVFYSSNIKNIANSLNNLIKSLITERYRIVVPFDDNFSMPASTTVFTQITVKKRYLDGNSIKEESIPLIYKGSDNTLCIEDKLQYKSKLSTFYNSNLRIHYQSSLNALIIDLQAEDFNNSNVENLTCMNPYVTYIIDNIQLSYSGNGCHFRTGGKEYVTVSDNSTATSQIQNSSTTQDKSINSIISSLSMNRSVANGNNADETTKISGAYVVVEPEKSFDNNTQYNGKLVNYAQPLWLPIKTGSIKLYKYMSYDNESTGQEVTTTVPLSASFQIYDENGDIVKLSVITSPSSTYGLYSVSATGSTNTFQSSTNYTTLISLPLGTYYIYESEYPSGGSDSYGPSPLSDANKELVELKIPNGSTTETKRVNAIKVNLTSDNTTASVTEYNKQTPKTYKQIVGRKLCMYQRTHSDTDYLPGAKMGLFSSFTDAQNKENVVKTAISDEYGYYKFSAAGLATGTSYYVAELEAPKGYQVVNTVKWAGNLNSRYVEDDNIETLNVEDYILDVELKKVKVKVDSSDSLKEGFDIQLVGKRSDTGAIVGEYTGTTNSEGELEFEVPGYYTYSIYPGTSSMSGGPDRYIGISYTVKETGYNGGDIPSRYLFQEYDGVKAEESNPGNVAEDWYGHQMNYYVSGVTRIRNDTFEIYNPSLKLTVHNFDGDDRATPLYSSYKTINGETITTDIDLPEYIKKGEVNDWSVGNLNTSDGSEYQNGLGQYRTDYYAVDDATSIKLSIEGDLYTYSILYYDENKNFVSSANENKDSSFVSVVPSTAAYYRIVRLNKNYNNEGNKSLEITHIKGGTSTFDKWFGNGDFIEENGNKKLYLQQTQVQPSYNLLRENFSTNYNSYTTMYDENTGNKYYHLDVTVYNVRPYEFPKVGGNGYLIYLIIGSAIISTMVFIYLLQRKRKNTKV